MHITHKLLVDTSNETASAFSDKCLAALGHGPQFKLKADKSDDTVHGSITIAHYDGYCDVIIEVYEVDEEPTVKMSHGMKSGRESRLAKPAKMPTEKELKDKLDLHFKEKK